MTRKEEIKEMATTTASHITSDKDMQVAFADVLRRGAEWADRTMIDKACEWFEKTFKASELIAPLLLVQLKDNFRKAMKGE